MNKNFLKVIAILCSLTILPGSLLANTREKSENYSKTTSGTHGSAKTTVHANQKQVQQTPGVWVNEGGEIYSGSSTTIYNTNGAAVASVSTQTQGNGAATTTITSNTGEAKTVNDTIVKNDSNTATLTIGNTNENVSSNSNGTYQINSATINNKTYDKRK